MTYTQVNAILTDRDAALREEHAPLVPLPELPARALRAARRRQRRGSIDST
ncbi:MAG: hypothetical protein R2752_13835 [Vicinamibacterales bacterium]